MDNVDQRLKVLISEKDRLESEGPDELVLKIANSPVSTIPVLESALKLLTERRDRILQDDIPSLLAEFGLKQCTTEDGRSVSIDTFYSTSQKDCDKAMLQRWLEVNGYGEVIKDTLALGKGEFDEKLSAFLTKNGYSYTRDSSVNGQTLKKVITDHLLAGGDPPPSEAVSVKVYTQAVVKEPKEHRGF